MSMQQIHVKRYRLEVDSVINCNKQCQGSFKNFREGIRKSLSKPVTSDYRWPLAGRIDGLQMWLVFIKKANRYMTYNYKGGKYKSKPQ